MFSVNRQSLYQIYHFLLIIIELIMKKELFFINYMWELPFLYTAIFINLQGDLMNNTIF
jgi:hypothetical protein